MIYENLGKGKIPTRKQRIAWWIYRHLPRAWTLSLVAGYIAECGKMMHDCLSEEQCDAWLRLQMLSAMFFRLMHRLDDDPDAFDAAVKTLTSIRCVCAAAANTLDFIDPDKSYGHLGGSGGDEVH